jgi:lysophospholipase L1-like esterase
MIDLRVVGRRWAHTVAARPALAAAGLALAAVTACAVAPATRSAPNPASGTYVALGDSYTSPPISLHLVSRPDGCLRSAGSYPAIVAAKLHPARFVDASCYGASTLDMTRPQRTVLGTNPPQLRALSKADTLVTIQIGGNDVGFTHIAVACGLLSVADRAGAPCETYYTFGGTDRLSQAISATAPKVAAVLNQIRRRAPRARILVLGYPDILPTSGQGCWPAVPIASGDVAYLRGVETKLNRMLAVQAARHGAGYVNTYTGSLGHDACRGAGVAWIAGLVPSSPSAPYHPNALGERAMAREVLAVLG